MNNQTIERRRIATGIRKKQESEIFRFHTHDIEVMRDAARRWNNDYRQLVSGKFEGSFLIYQVEGIQFALSHWNQPVQVLGTAPDNSISLALLINDGRANWYGHKIDNQHIIFPHYSRDFDFIAHKETFIWTVAVDKHLLTSVAEAYNKPISESLLKGQVFMIQPLLTSLIPLRAYLHNLFSMLNQSDNVASMPAVQGLIQKDFLPLFINSCQSVHETETIDAPSVRFNLIKQIEELVLENPARPLTLHDLCHVTHTSKRNLQYIFRDCVGMSPMAFIKAQRLNGVRRYLKTCTDKHITITKIAAQWGFWHLGRFSHDYKAMFGESPSETLKHHAPD